MLTVIAENSKQGLVLRCRGRIIRGQETSILCSAAGQDGPNVVLDLREVETIDAAGIGALLSLQAAGIYMTLANPTEPLREIFRLTKLDSVFEICQDYFPAPAMAAAASVTEPVRDDAQLVSS